MSETAYQEKVLEVEPYGIEPIPQVERHGRPSQMFTIWFAINLNVATWFTGFLGIEFGLSLKHAIIAIIIGNLLGAIFLGLTSVVGPVSGQPLIPASKRAFGKAGVFGLSFLNLVNNVGWLAVNLVLAAMALQKLIPLGNATAVALLVVATLLIAVYGYNFIHSFAHWMSIIVGVMFIIMTVVSLKNLPLLVGQATSTPGELNWGMFVLAVAVAFSYQISYCPIGSDYSRYFAENTSKRKVWLWSYLGALSVCIWIEILGALTATLGMNAGPMDFFAQLMGVFTIPALITIIVSIFPVNAMAIYSGGLAALAMGIPMKRWTTAIVCGGLGAGLVSLAGGDFADTYHNFLLLLSYWIAPWLGVVLCDFFYYQNRPKEVGAANGGAGITAFLLGIAISIPFMSSQIYTGPIAANYLGHADISYFLSLMVSALVYWGTLKFIPVSDIKVLLKHDSGVTKEVKIGFSWTTLFFGFLVPLIRGDIKWGLIMLIITAVAGGMTFGIGALIVDIIFGYMYNKIFIEGLLVKGYKPAEDNSRKLLVQNNIMSV